MFACWGRRRATLWGGNKKQKTKARRDYRAKERNEVESYVMVKDPKFYPRSQRDMKELQSWHTEMFILEISFWLKLREQMEKR